jgi:hypothetical protein
MRVVADHWLRTGKAKNTDDINQYNYEDRVPIVDGRFIHAFEMLPPPEKKYDGIEALHCALKKTYALTPSYASLKSRLEHGKFHNETITRFARGLLPEGYVDAFIESHELGNHKPSFIFLRHKVVKILKSLPDGLQVSSYMELARIIHEKDSSIKTSTAFNKLEFKNDKNKKYRNKTFDEEVFMEAERFLSPGYKELPGREKTSVNVRIAKSKISDELDKRIMDAIAQLRAKTDENWAASSYNQAIRKLTEIDPRLKEGSLFNKISAGCKFTPEIKRAFDELVVKDTVSMNQKIKDAAARLKAKTDGKPPITSYNQAIRMLIEIDPRLNRDTLFHKISQGKKFNPEIREIISGFVVKKM